MNHIKLTIRSCWVFWLPKGGGLIVQRKKSLGKASGLWCLEIARREIGFLPEKFLRVDERTEYANEGRYLVLTHREAVLMP